MEEMMETDLFSEDEFEEEIRAKPLSREMLEDFSNRCARLELYDATERESMKDDLYFEARKYKHPDSYNHIRQADGKEGVWNDFLHHWTVPPKFDKVVREVNCGLNYVVMSKGRYGIVACGGCGGMVCPCKYDGITALYDFADLVRIEVNGRFGILSLYDGNTAMVSVEPRYDAVEPTDGGFLILKQNGKAGLYKYGYLLPAEYEQVFVPSVMGWVKVMKNGKWGYVDANNEFTTELDKAYLYFQS